MWCVCAQLKGTLMAWVQATSQGEGTQLPAFLRNKLAQIIVQVVRVRPQSNAVIHSKGLSTPSDSTDVVDICSMLTLANCADTASNELRIMTTLLKL